jgi:hypothetical protein
MKRLVLSCVAAGMLAAAAPVVGHAIPAAGHEVIVSEDAVIPRVLSVKTGERVDFRNAVNRLVHIEFGDDARRHEVVQIPVTGPIWAVFHQPGTHPYVVHVGAGKDRRTLDGVVDVVEDATHHWDASTCGVLVMGACLEP